VHETVVYSRHKASLNELCSDIVVLILQLRQAKTLPDPVQLRSRGKELFARFDHNARDMGLAAEEIDTARLALVAFFDEAVFGLEFNGKSQWQENPLGMELLGINYAGVEFFKRLEECRRRSRERQDVLELLLLCLMLGYKGQYMNDPEGLRRLIAEVRSEFLHSKDGKSASQLSPGGKPEGEIRMFVRSEIPAWVVVFSAIAIALLFYAFMTWQINDVANAALTSIMSGLR
jgi:type VI secretion system protein ImpK